MRSVVLSPSRCGASAMRPPWRITTVRSGSSSSRYCALLTWTSGRMRSSATSGVLSPKPTTTSTLRSASSTSARSANATIGRASPLMRRTDSSVLSPTINASPCSRAHARYSTWPACDQIEAAVGKDDAPLLHAQPFAPRRRFVETQELAEESALGHVGESSSAKISSGDAVAVPSFATTAPAAKFANCIACSIGAPAASAKRRAPRSTVSPAPLTS